MSASIYRVLNTGWGEGRGHARVRESSSSNWVCMAHNQARRHASHSNLIETDINHLSLHPPPVCKMYLPELKLELDWKSGSNSVHQHREFLFLKKLEMKDAISDEDTLLSGLERLTEYTTNDPSATSGTQRPLIKDVPMHYFPYHANLGYHIDLPSPRALPAH